MGPRINVRAQQILTMQMKLLQRARRLVEDMTEQAGETGTNIQFARLMHKECVCDVSAPIFKFVFAVKGERSRSCRQTLPFCGTDDSYHIFERPYTPIQVLNFRPAGSLDSETEDVE